MMRGSNEVRYCFIASGVSRAGSTETKTGCTLSASGPSFSIISVKVLRAVGQASGQKVKPKKNTEYLPLRAASVTS